MATATFGLSNANDVFTVDEQYYFAVDKYKWYCDLKSIKNTSNRYMILSRYIMELEGYDLTNKVVMHADGNIYNNTVKNLLVLDLACRNRLTTSRKRTNTSGYIGVSSSKSKKWISQLYFRKTKYYLGSYNTKIGAAKAYNAKLKSLPIPESCKVYNII